MFYCNKEGIAAIKGNVLVVGDSVTDGGKYVSYLNSYFRLHQPQEEVQFINLGVSSETVSGLSEPAHPFPRPCVLNRMDKITDHFQAAMAIICYGINDGIYYPLSQERMDAYEKGMEILVEKFQQKGIEVCIMTPPPFDCHSFQHEMYDIDALEFSYLNPYIGYNEVMGAYANMLLDKFAGTVSTIINLHSILSEDIKTRREVDPAYRSGDGIHPDQHGHYIIARTILSNLFHVNLSKFEDMLSGDNGTFLKLIEEKDLILHSYYKEMIGHDNPFKNQVFPYGLMGAKIKELDTTIDTYIKNHKEVVEQDGIWEGFQTKYFYFQGYEVTVVIPPEPKEQNPWIYRTEFFGAFPYVDIAMVKQGYYLAHIQIGDRYGAPCAVTIMEDFRKMMTGRFQCMECPILFGFSRGGLYALHYVAAYPENVCKVYLDAPVINIHSWPQQLQDGMSIEWYQCQRIWQLNINCDNTYMDIMKKAIEVFINAKIPLIIVAGDSDPVVPYTENGQLLQEKYKSANLPFKLILKAGVGHHPHSLVKCDEIVDYLLKKD